MKSLTRLVAVIVLNLKCFGFFLSGAVYDPTYNLGFYISA